MLNQANDQKKGSTYKQRRVSQCKRFIEKQMRKNKVFFIKIQICIQNRMKCRCSFPSKNEREEEEEKRLEGAINNK